FIGRARITPARTGKARLFLLRSGCMPDRPRNPARDARQITIRGAREHALIGNILPIGLIPRPLGTKNLRNLLGKSRWTKLRRANLPTPLRCDVCNLLVRHSSELHA